MVFERLRKISTEEVKSLDLTALTEVWKSNHQIVLDHILRGEPPYFGVHANSQHRLQQIIRKGGGPGLFWATFYDKRIDEPRLYQLYAAMGYISGFSGSDKDGGYLVLDFQKEDGSNISLQRKRLKGTGDLEIQLTTDDEHVRKILTQLEEDS